ncbi:MAG: GGDEF domain-containing protein, partial [Neisseriaceae bacterium]
LIGVNYPQIDWLDCYLLSPDGTLRQQYAGDKRPFGMRPLPHRHFHFRLDLPPGQRTTVYLRAQSGGTLLLPVQLLTPWQLQGLDHHQLLLSGIFIGTLLAMLLYNLLLFFSLREKTYLYYVLYIGSFGLAQATLYGYGSEYLWPAHPLNDLALPLATSLTGVFLGLFSRRFLELGSQWPAAERVINIFIGLFAVTAICTLFLDYQLVIKVAIGASLIGPAALFLIGARLWYGGYRPARYFLVAFAVLLLGFLANGLTSFNLTPDNLLSDYGMPVGSMLEITLLSFALAHRLKLAREDNERLQQQHAAELEQRVASRTRALDQALHDLTQANQQLQRLTVHDALTGLKNRQFFDQHLQHTWRQALRWQQPLGLLMIDIDYFKRVNDSHGHPAGDEALRRIAKVIAGCLRRPGDEAIRYGGEEFAVILPHTDGEGISYLAECIRSRATQLQFVWEGQAIPLSVSIGAALILPQAGHETQQLVQQADQLLYQAKQGGRNRCVFSANVG